MNTNLRTRILLVAAAAGGAAAWLFAAGPISRLTPAERALWAITPPPPQQTDAERRAELAARRAAVLKQMGPNDVLVLYAAEPRVFSGDVDYPYRQENNLYYLTQVNQEGAVLVMSPAATPNTILSMPVPDPAQESWTGHELSAAETRALTGIDEIRDAAQFPRVLDYLVPGTAAAVATETARGLAGRGGRGAGRGAAANPEPPTAAVAGLDPVKAALASGSGKLWLLNGDQRHYAPEDRLAAALASVAPALTRGNAATLFAAPRNIKSPWEIALIQHAVDISAEAHLRGMALTAPGVWEYQIRAEFEMVYGMRHADGWGYPEIVASGTNPTTLHYESDQERIPDQGLMLIDAAAMYAHYSADVTRTFPLTGKFTPEQAAIYQIVYAAQQAMIGAVKPELSAAAAGRLGSQTMTDGLTRLGLITSAPGAPPAARQLAIWYFHGPSHPIGLDVHDVQSAGGANAAGLYQAGQIVTEEPGIYLRPATFDEDLPRTNDPATAAQWKVFTDAVRPVFEKYKGIGVRIEDDVLVTPDGHRVLSAAVPSRLDEVEARLAALHASVKKNGSAPAFLPLD